MINRNRADKIVGLFHILSAHFPWSKHPVFEGVELKHIITSEKTDGQFSFHLVKIAGNRELERIRKI